MNKVMFSFAEAYIQFQALEHRTPWQPFYIKRILVLS